MPQKDSTGRGTGLMSTVGAASASLVQQVRHPPPADMQPSRGSTLATQCSWWQWTSWALSLRVRLGTPTSWWQGTISLGGWRFTLSPINQEATTIAKKWWTACSADFQLQSKYTLTRADSLRQNCYRRYANSCTSRRPAPPPYRPQSDGLVEQYT